MHAELQATVAFHLTGKRAEGEAGSLSGAGLRPALLAGYRDLTQLRYDYPLVLLRGAPDQASYESLSRLIDQALEKTALLGQNGERLRAHALRLEQELRALAVAGGTGSLLELLDEAARRLAPDAALADSGRRLRAALPAAGEAIDCDVETPGRLLAHVWHLLQQKKAAAFHRRVDRLVLKLEDILRADYSRSKAARAPASLKASVGAPYAEAFDFNAMSRLLANVSCGSTLSDRRRRRIEVTLAALKSQRFYTAPGAAGDALEFRFGDCASALAAFRRRVPEMIGLARAITIAQLEIDGEYSEPRHDPLFERLAAAGLDLGDLALFPDYLVCVKAQDLRAVEHGELMDILAGGLPMKILVQSDDLLGEPEAAAGHPAFGARSRQFANMAIGLNDVFVLQTSSSNLLRCRDGILRAMRYPGPALVSVFSGATGHCGNMPPYLVSAAAVESRAFPALAYDPGAGPDWASRFSLEGNPQAERDWPLHTLGYEDAGHQRVSEEVAFTLLDFVACDQRYAEHYAVAPRAYWSGALATVAEVTGREQQGVPDKLPGLPMVDRDCRLHKVIVDERLLREARRCREMWFSLQELGGIHNSHAERALARERKCREEERQSKVQGPAAAPEAPAAPAPAPQAAPAAQAEPEQERPSDEPYIETPRCSSCDECIQINNKMFAYDANKQARIVDPLAGTYRQLVEAAESCQVAVIHPGKPMNLKESGLDELLQRAEPFL